MCTGQHRRSVLDWFGGDRRRGKQACTWDVARRPPNTEVVMRWLLILVIVLLVVGAIWLPRRARGAGRSLRNRLDERR